MVHKSLNIWPEADERLKALWAQGLPIREIARQMDTTPNAIAGRRKRLNLLTRGSPIKGPRGEKAIPVPRHGAAAVEAARRAFGVEIVRKRSTWAMSSPDRPQAPANTLTLDVHDQTIRDWEYRGAVALKKNRLPIPVGAIAPARTCQWPTTDRRPWAFCGCAAVAGYSYCAGHKVQAFRSYVPGDVA